MSKPITLHFPEGIEEVNTILAGLGELPAKMSYHLIRSVEQQAQDQMKEQEAPNVPVTDGT